MNSNSYSYIRKVPYYRDLDTKTLKRIAKITDEIDVPAGQIICKQGAVGYEFVFVLEGTARVEKDRDVVNRLSAGDFYGEIALVSKKSHTATVITETDMKLLVVGIRHFEHLLEISPSLRKAIEVRS